MSQDLLWDLNFPYIVYVTKQSCMLNTTIIPILQMKYLRLGVKSFPQIFTDSKYKQLQYHTWPVKFQNLNF